MSSVSEIFSDRRRRGAIARELLVFALFVALAVAATWPLARHLGVATADPGDPYINTWILDWVYHAAGSGVSLFDANIFHPAPLTLTFSENLIGIAIMMLPFRFGGAEPLAIHNIAMLLGFATSGYGAFVLARVASGSAAAAVAAGVFFMLVPWRFTHLTHLQHQWCVWLAVMFAALLAHARQPSWKVAAAFAVATTMNGLTNLHWFAFGAFAAIAVAGALAVMHHRVRDRRYWISLAASGALSLLVLLPVLLQYRSAKELYGLRGDASETLRYSARPADWLIADPASRYGSITNDGTTDPERWLFPGLAIFCLAVMAVWPIAFSRTSSRSVAIASVDVLIAIAACAAILGVAAVRHIYWAVGDTVLINMNTSRNALLVLALLASVRCVVAWSTRRRYRETLVAPDALVAGVALVLIGYFGSLGLNGSFFRILFENVALFSGIRAPARWAMLAYVGMAILAACGLARLWRFCSRRVAIALTVAAFTFLAFDLTRPRTRYFLDDRFVPPVYEWLERARFDGGVLELPMEQRVSYSYMLWATRHHRPLVNGVSGYAPPHYQQLQAMLSAAPVAERALDTIHQLDVDVIIVHADLLAERSQPTREWLRKEADAGRLTFIGRFDSYQEGDYVFALRGRSIPPISRVDGAGRTAAAELQRFLSAEGHAYNSRTFGATDYPAHGSVVRGALRVTGWALSPHGVREVNVLLANHAQRVRATLAPYPHISAVFPWYPKTTEPRYSVDFASRPDGLDAATDVQIEIVDGSGSRTLLPNIWFRWE